MRSYIHVYKILLTKTLRTTTQYQTILQKTFLRYVVKCDTMRDELIIITSRKTIRISYVRTLTGVRDFSGNNTDDDNNTILYNCIVPTTLSASSDDH